MAELAIEIGRRTPCEVTVAIDDWVFIRSDGKADKAKADTKSTMPAVGFVVQKDGDDRCFIKTAGIYKRSGQSFGRGQRHFISASQAGRVVEGPPTGIPIQQVVGIGDADPDVLLVQINMGIDATAPVVDPFSVGTEGQTDFTLSEAPADPADVRLFINGLQHQKDIDFTLGGPVSRDLVWLDAFSLKTGDSVVAVYAAT